MQRQWLARKSCRPRESGTRDPSIRFPTRGSDLRSRFLRSRTCTSFRKGSLSNNHRHRIAEAILIDRWANLLGSRISSTLTPVKAMVVILLAFSATGSLQCSARCQAWRDGGNWERPESQQRWPYQLDVVEKRARPVRSFDPTSGSRAVRMISSCRNSATRSREHTASTRPAWAHLDPCFEAALFSSARAPARMSARA